jgi:anaerobic magnesium-protoporphyrin IX monomethyl ester cyclase
MRVLFFSMPDSSEHMPTNAIRMPNGALSSIAGNLDPHHLVGIADLILVQGKVRETVTKFVTELEPEVVGLSVMTFQRHTAQKIIALVRSLRPSVKIVVGGYDPSLATEAYTLEGFGVDFIVRGEGEITFRDLLRALEGALPFSAILGLTYRQGSEWIHNTNRPISSLEDIKPPKRSGRLLSGYTFLGSAVDVIETSRGCTFDCSFCSIIEMRGRNFFSYSFDRILEDIRDAYRRGSRAIFIVDDNISLNVHRLEGLCRAIIDAGLNDIDYTVQAMTSSIANHGETLAPLMAKAGFRYIFLGIENIIEEDLTFLKASAKNYRRENGKRVGNASIKAIEYLHQYGMCVVGGLIIGNPDDTQESIEANLDFARRYIDWPYIQHPTPYPRTPMTKDFAMRGLIENESVETYDGTTAVIKTKHLSADEIEFLRWRAERWMKVRHVPSVLRRYPSFVFKNARSMFSFTFRGSTWKTFLGLEDERLAFKRYQALRVQERTYL